MLQQTQVDRVLPKYHEWLEKYPSLEALAEAPEHDVTETWRPLGYNIRPKRLQAIAREAVATYGGQAAVGRSHAAVVQGHRRVYGRRDSQLRVPRARGHPRHERGARAVSRVRRQRRAESARDEEAPVEHLGGARPARRAFDFNQALMDFGATLCTARKPKCLICPMAALCAAYPHNPENEARRA